MRGAGEMEKITTTYDLFARAIAAEKAAKDFYDGLSHIFSHVPEASLLWKQMKDDEDLHARELEDIRNGLTAEQLSSPADRSLAGEATAELRNFSGKLALRGIETLDDALDRAYELEYSEINTAFQAMVKEFVSSEARVKFILSLVEEHVSRLEEFSRIIPHEESWKKISALHGGDASI